MASESDWPGGPREFTAVHGAGVHARRRARACAGSRARLSGTGDPHHRSVSGRRRRRRAAAHRRRAARGRWGYPVIVENRVGASGSIGAEAVWRAEPDGYTLLATPPAPLVINPSLYEKLAYDPTRFVPVTVIAAIPSVLLVNAEKIHASTLQEFVALVRANPATFDYA